MTVSQAVSVDAFMRFMETGEDPDGIVARDVFADLNVPSWRYQLKGDDVREMIRNECAGSTYRAERVLETPSGFVTEAVQEMADGVLFRQTILAEVRDGKVAEFTMYCTGAWDAGTIERQAREAPMIRPDR